MLLARAHRIHHTSRYRACVVLIAPVGASHASGMEPNRTPDFSIKNGSTLHKIDSFNYTRYSDLYIHFRSAKQTGLMKK
jgi:hypothetical protein